MDRKQYVVVYAPAKTGRMPMVLKNKPDFLKGVLNLPGGKLEEGESSLEAAARELKEETGIIPWAVPVLLGKITGNHSDIHVVRIEVKEQPLAPAEGETEEFSWQDIREVYQHPNLMPNLRLAVPLCLSGAQGWNIYDWSGDWRGLWHTISLQLDPVGGHTVEVRVPGMNYYRKDPCTTQVIS